MNTIRQHQHPAGHREGGAAWAREHKANSTGWPCSHGVPTSTAARLSRRVATTIEGHRGRGMTTAINYLGYAKTGHEFEVCEELIGQGIDAWAGRVIRWKRTGKKRHPEPHEEPALPNYVFMALDDQTFHSALRVRFLAKTLVMLGPADRRDLAKFQAIIEREFEWQDRIRRNAEMPKTEFDPGQEIEIIGGPFADKIGTFRRIVERSNQLFPKLEAEVGGLKLQLDPLDVRGVG